MKKRVIFALILVIGMIVFPIIYNTFFIQNNVYCKPVPLACGLNPETRPLGNHDPESAKKTHRRVVKTVKSPDEMDNLAYSVSFVLREHLHPPQPVVPCFSCHGELPEDVKLLRDGKGVLGPLSKTRKAVQRETGPSNPTGSGV